MFSIIEFSSHQHGWNQHKVINQLLFLLPWAQLVVMVPSCHHSIISSHSHGTHLCQYQDTTDPVQFSHYAFFSNKETLHQDVPLMVTPYVKQV